jgi:hypothetical protein
MPTARPSNSSFADSPITRRRTLAGGGSQRHANADFARAARDGKGHNAVNTDGGEQ